MLSILFGQLISPDRVGIEQQVRVVEVPVARHFRPQKGRSVKGLVLAPQLHLGKYQSFVVAMELIHLKLMPSMGHYPTCLVNESATAQLQQLMSLGGGNLLLELHTAEPAIQGRPLDGQVSLVVPCPHTYRCSLALEVALLYMCVADGKRTPKGSWLLNQELTFYLKQSCAQCFL